MLETRELTKIYKPKKGAPVVALNKVSIKFPSKGMVFLLGKSGSGKSTLLNLLGGLDKYTSGEIIIKGVSSKSFRQKHFDSYRNTYVGFIFQEYNILDDFSVGANIALAIELQGRKATNEEINAILRDVDLEGYGDRKPTELSGGQKQRVAIARALVKKPEIIMADEPTGALDSNTGRQVFETLKKLSKERLVIVVSHDREFSETYADRIIELADGKVISDVEYTADEGEKEDTIKFSENTIELPMGYMLTEEDRIAINEYIKALQNHDVVSINLKKSTRKAQFKNTDESKIEKQDGSNFKLIKSVLPLKNAFKIGASGLKHKKFRLVVTILLCVVSFTLFGLADTIASYNNFDANVKSIMDSNINYASFSKAVRYYYNQNRFYWDDYYAKLTDYDIGVIKAKSGVDVLGVVSLAEPPTLYYNLSYKDSKSESNVYKPQLSGLVDATAGMFEKFGFELIAGRKPEKGKREIVITKFTYTPFEGNFYYRYKDKDGTDTDSSVVINNYSDLIGKEVYLGTDYGSFTIVGIVDTKFDGARYAPLDEKVTGEQQLLDEIQRMLLMTELEFLKQYSTHTLGFVSEGMTKALTELQKDNNNVNNYGNISLEFTSENGFGYGLSFNYFNKFENVKSSDILWFNGQKSTLSKNEIIVPLETLKTIIQTSSQAIKGGYDDKNFKYALKYNDGEIFSEMTSFSEFVYNIDMIMLFNYAKNNVDEAKEYFKNASPATDVEQEPENNLVREYFYFLSIGSENPYGKNKPQIYSESLADLLKTYDLMPRSEDMTLFVQSHKNGKSSVSYGVNIVGILLETGTGNNFNAYSSYVIIGNETVEALGTDDNGIYNFAVGVMPKERSGIERVVRFALDDKGDVRYKLKDPVSESLEDISSAFEQLAKVFFWIGFAFAIFASVMFSNFIATSISYKKRDIGILRAIGSRSNDVFRIFFAESFIIAVINFVLSFSLTAFFAAVLNKEFKEGTSLLISVLNVGIRQFIVMFAICLFVAFIASFLPIKKIASKSPIDAISNR